MSFDATGWAFYLRGVPHSPKILLLELADCHNPDYGCFAGRDYLADRCEVSDNNLEELIVYLEEAALIRRVTCFDPMSEVDDATRYVFAFEDDFATVAGEDQP